MKKKQTTQEKSIRAIHGILVLIVLFAFIGAIGLHNADTCQNLRYINEVGNIKFVENSITIRGWEPINCYMIGMGMITLSFFDICFIALATLFKLQEKVLKKR